jgi:ATP-binding cassette subfamily B protein
MSLPNAEIPTQAPARAPRLWAIAPLIWRASGWQATLWSILIVARAAMPIAVAFAFARVIGTVPDAAGQGLGSDAGGRLLIASIVASAIFMLSQAIWRATRVVSLALGHRLEAQIQFEVLDAAGRLTGLAELEDPRVREAIGSVGDVETGAYPGREIIDSIHTVASSALLAIGAAVLLATFRWWAPLLLMSGWLLQDLWSRHQFKSSQGLDAERESEDPERYRAYRSLALEAPAAKEVRIFGLGDWVSERAERHWRANAERMWRTREIPGLIAAGLLVVQFAGTVIVFQAIVRAGAQGEIGVDRVALYVQVALGPIMSLYQPYAVMIFRQAVQPLLGGLAVSALGAGPPGDDAVEESLPAVELRVKDLRFRYPDSERDILTGVDLHFPAGRSVAIVGENGAGKTTLVKLLTRLYEPTGGTIEADGAPLDSIAPTAWRSRIGVVFQDFAHYPLSVRENVTFGRVSAEPDAAQLAHAARDAKLEPLVEELSDGWDTVLAREFGGTDLSGGQWQRVALARALYSVRMGAGLLILDEPTASLDARMEAELFDRFLELTRGVTTVLISHRFSTVRRVDLIYVIEHGSVVEQGSHDDLMAQQGRYAEMFTLQAARFATAEAGDA